MKMLVLIPIFVPYYLLSALRDLSQPIRIILVYITSSLSCQSSSQAVNNMKVALIQVKHDMVMNPNWKKATIWLFTKRYRVQIELS